MEYSKLIIGKTYRIHTNPNLRLCEYGMTPGTEVILMHILNGVYVFSCRGTKVGIRKSELGKIDFRIIK